MVVEYDLDQRNRVSGMEVGELAKILEIDMALRKVFDLTPATSGIGKLQRCAEGCEPMYVTLFRCHDLTEGFVETTGNSYNRLSVTVTATT